MADIGICLRSHLLHTLPILHMYTIFLSLHIYTISHISRPQFSYLTHIHNFPILQMYTIPHFIHTYTLPILHTYTISPFFYTPIHNFPILHSVVLTLSPLLLFLFFTAEVTNDPKHFQLETEIRRDGPEGC